MMREDLMVQQQVGSRWQHMVGVICLNQTGRKKVKNILPDFFKKISNCNTPFAIKQRGSSRDVKRSWYEEC